MSEIPRDPREPTVPGEPDSPPPAADDTLVLENAPAGQAPRRRWLPPNLDREVGIALVVLLLLLGLGAAGVWWVTREDEQTAPDVIGLELEEAQQRLSDDGLASRIERVPSDAPVDEVVDQAPAAGEKVSDGEVVELTISEGPATVVLPRVVGSTVEVASETLEEAGIRFETRGVASRQPLGTVVRQNPSAGQEVDRTETVVVLAVAEREAPETVAVPGLVGMASAEARDALDELGLRSTQRPQASAQEEGTVIRQSPGAGSEVPEGSTVTLVVSTGPATVDVPDVVGLSEQDARRELSSAGFDVEVEDRPTDDPGLAGLVESQRPAAGTSAARGSVVTIVVARRN